MEKLALIGGKPVCVDLFPSNTLGSSLIGEEELNELKDVVMEKSPFRHYGIGAPKKVATFEKEVKEYFECKYTLAVSSGTSALLCAVAALGIGPGDEVILPAFGWYSDYSAIINSGALPVFADIDESLNLDPKDMERKITSKTRAIIVVHYQGCAADMDEIMAITKRHHLKIIEDCAQAFGGEYKGRKLGTMGDIAISSFQSNKVLTCGEGGVLITNYENCFVRAVRYHDLGFVRQCFAQQVEDKTLLEAENAFIGMQFRMSELQGAFILAQFRKLESMLEKLRKQHKMIREHFAGNEHFKIRYKEGDCGFTVFLKFESNDEAQKFLECLKAEGIPVGPSSSCLNMVPQYIIHSKQLFNNAMPPFGKGFDGEKTVYKIEKCCPNTDRITGCMAAIGIGALYSDENVREIIRAIEKVDANLYTKI